MATTDFIFPEDWRTLRQAAYEKQVSYDACRMWCRLHNVPTRRVGRSLVVRMRDLEAYVPQGTRHDVSTH